jgi:hypothetical protein
MTGGRSRDTDAVPRRNLAAHAQDHGRVRDHPRMLCTMPPRTRHSPTRHARTPGAPRERSRHEQALRRTPSRALRWQRPQDLLRTVLGTLVLLTLSGCGAEVWALSSFAIGAGLAAFALSRATGQRALAEAERLRFALASGQQREIEGELRAVLALAEAGEAVSAERQWVARAQLAAMLVAEWRLDEARLVYEADDAKASPLLRDLARFGRHEISVLTQTPDEARLAEIRSDRDTCLGHVPPGFAAQAKKVWDALEGLCLVRMSRYEAGVALLSAGVDEVFELAPSRVVYLFHLAQALEALGDREAAHRRYGQAASAFPGTRLASDANARSLALEGRGASSMFRGMLPESPSAESVALVPVNPRDDDA